MEHLLKRSEALTPLFIHQHILQRLLNISLDQYVVQNEIKIYDWNFE